MKMGGEDAYELEHFFKICFSCGAVAARRSLEINFQNLGPWFSFQLHRATNIARPFFPISGLVPVMLGGGNHRYDYLPTNNTGELFRIEGL